MRNRSHHQPQLASAPSTAGFTLVEVLVATAILMLLVVLLANVLGSVTNLSSQASSRLNATRLGREVFDLLGRDLSQVATTRTSLGTNAPLQFCVNPPQLANAYKNATAVFWQAAISRDRSVGNISVVGYFVQNTSTNRGQLRRVLLEPADSDYAVYSSPTNWLPEATAEKFAAAAGSSASSKADRGWVADGVIGMWVRCLDVNGQVIATNGAGAVQNYSFDSRLGYQSGSGTNRIVYSTFATLPAFVDIGLVCVAPKDADRIRSLPAATATSPLNFDSEMAAYVTAFSASNPRVKSVTSLTRRFRLYGSY